MSDLTSGRTEPCKGVGGLKELYLMDFVPYSTRSFGGFKSSIITSFPATLIHEFEGTNKEVAEQWNNDVFEQQIKIRMAKQDLPTSQLVDLLSNKLTRAIAVFNNGTKKLFGLENGLDCEVEINTGAAKSDFNGYELVFNGVERFESHFVNDLTTTGFLTEGVLFGCLLSSSGRPSSIADLVSSCSSIINEIQETLFLSSSGEPSSVNYLTSAI